MSNALATRSAGALVPVDDIENALDDSPRRELRVGAVVIFLFFGLFLGWAAFARLDAAAYAQGQVTVSGHRQSVQHKDGGTVTSLSVKEGQHVQAGQVLMTLESGAILANERATASQVISLMAQRSRLMAERVGGSVVPVPAEFATLSPEERLEADQVLRLQNQELQARLYSVRSQKSVLAQRARQLNEQINGFKNQMGETDNQSRLMGEELSGTRDLAAQGYASTNRVRDLERQVSGLRSQKADLAANAARANAQIGETQMQALTIDTQRAEEVSKELRDVDTQLSDLEPKLKELKRQLADTQVRAPATGQVVGLSIFTVGGVVAPGQKVLDIVPDAAPMVLEAQVSPNDADDLRVGQETEIKITAFHERNLPILKGELTRLSADSFQDEKSGLRYFTAEVTVPAAEIDKIVKARGKDDGALRPGLPVQVLIPLRRRTALQYMLEPITQAIWKSGREH